MSDVNEIVSYLQDQGITDYTMENVPAESWIMTLLPYLIIFAAMFIFFMIMTNQAAVSYTHLEYIAMSFLYGS